MTVTAHFSFHLDPSQLEHAYEVIHSSLAATRAFPGNIGVEAWIDDDQLANVETSGRKLSMRIGEIELSQPLGIASFRTHAALRNIKMRRL